MLREKKRACAIPPTARPAATSPNDGAIPTSALLTV
jgi:hypothetical protein